MSSDEIKDPSVYAAIRVRLSELHSRACEVDRLRDQVRRDQMKARIITVAQQILVPGYGKLNGQKLGTPQPATVAQSEATFRQDLSECG